MTRPACTGAHAPHPPYAPHPALARRTLRTPRIRPVRAKEDAA